MAPGADQLLWIWSLRGWRIINPWWLNTYFCDFSPLPTWKRWFQIDWYFSNGLKPLTRPNFCRGFQLKAHISSFFQFILGEFRVWNDHPQDKEFKQRPWHRSFHMWFVMAQKRNFPKDYSRSLPKKWEAFWDVLLVVDVNGWFHLSVSRLDTS